jgi:polysaccharide export outer membrane protein
MFNLAGIALLVGCSSLPGYSGGSSIPARPKTGAPSEEAAGRLRPGDQIQIRLDFGGQPGRDTQSLDQIIDENGEITLPLVGAIKAVGLTQTELAERVQAYYVPRYYVRCAATVLVAQRFFYMNGEVRNPTRIPWSEDMTLLKAISTAGGFTDYANRRRVELTRGNQRMVYNCDDLQRNPGRDVPIRPGDTITIPRSIF